MPKRTNALTITRHFTTAGGDPFDTVEWARRRSAIYNTDGSVLFEMNDVEVPAHWDQVAVDILVSKFFRKAGVPQLGPDGSVLFDAAGSPVLGGETSARQWAHRLANAWRVWGERGGYFNEEGGRCFYDELVYMLLHQMASPNSPQHFNTGLFEAYGLLSDPEGNWYFDPESGTLRQSVHRFERSAANACFILSVADELVGDGSIFDYIEREARLFKAGSGSGANLSNIRAKGERLSGGGSASGVMGFMRVADRAAGAIKSGGTTRRAAKMVILDVDHPEIEDFIWCKVREEEKVAALVAGGYSADWNGEAYDTVSFQNGNNSVRILPGFMQAVRNGRDWQLRGRQDRGVDRTMPARKLWNDIAEAAWRCADPGVQYDDLLNEWNTAGNDGRLRATNPCSEYTHLDDTACNLASLNLVKFFNDDTLQFDAAAFAHAARLLTIVLEITVHMSHYPSPEVARNSYEHRTLGLGYANLGALLMRSGVPYDSAEGTAVTGAITALMHDVAYATSAELASVVGACIAFTRNTEPMSRVIRNHARAAYGTLPHDLGAYEQLSVTPTGVDHAMLTKTHFANLSAAVCTAAESMLAGLPERGGAGYRNMQVTVLAPTGTIGLQLGCDTTGVEPDFALVKFKKLAGGGYMKIVNGSVAPALRALGYDSTQTQRILTYAIGTATLHGLTAVNAKSLAAKGLPPRAIERVERQLPAVTNLRMAFAPYVVGTDVLEEMQVTSEQYGSDDFDLLRHLGFSGSEIESSSDAICGHQTVEGAPDLCDEHLAVFDTANYCGDGTRVIAWQGHVRALGAVAPHLSGSASKTINLPNEATLEEIRDAYEMSYDLGVKCAAVYRDGSKLSQVLSSRKESAADAEEAKEIEAAVNAANALIRPGQSPSDYYHGTTPPKFRLPEMRFGPTWKMNVGGTDVFLRANEYEDGTLGEIFIDLSKEGSTLKGVLSCFAISVSQGLQHGVPLAKFVETFTFHNFAPQGMVTGHANLKMANSLIDAIFRVLAFHYLERADLVQVATPPMRLRRETGAVLLAPAASEKDLPGKREEQVVTAASPAPGVGTNGKMFSSSGETCRDCGGQMVKSGTCSRCLSCGNTTGCS